MFCLYGLSLVPWISISSLVCIDSNTQKSPLHILLPTQPESEKKKRSRVSFNLGPRSSADQFGDRTIFHCCVGSNIYAR